jgi:hypothetical protein
MAFPKKKESQPQYWHLAEQIILPFISRSKPHNCAALPVAVTTCANKLTSQCKSWEISCGDYFGWIV